MRSRFIHNQKGQSMMEYILIMPILLIVFLAVVEYSAWFFFMSRAQTAARETLLLAHERCVMATSAEINSDLNDCISALVQSPPVPLYGGTIQLSVFGDELNPGTIEPMVTQGFVPNGFQNFWATGENLTKISSVVASKDRAFTAEYYKAYIPLTPFLGLINKIGGDNVALPQYIHIWEIM